MARNLRLEEKIRAFFHGSVSVSDSLKFPLLETTSFCKAQCILIKPQRRTQTFQTPFWFAPSGFKAGLKENNEGPDAQQGLRSVCCPCPEQNHRRTERTITLSAYNGT